MVCASNSQSEVGMDKEIETRIKVAAFAGNGCGLCLALYNYSNKCLAGSRPLVISIPGCLRTRLAR